MIVKLNFQRTNVLGVQCTLTVQCAMCSMKCTPSDSEAFAGAGAVRNVHFTVCRVQCSACQRLKF